MGTMRMGGQICARFSFPVLESSPFTSAQEFRRNQLPPCPSSALTLLTGGDRRVPLAPKLALRLLRALQGITKVALKDNDVLQAVGGLQPSHFSILDLWPGAANCWKGRARGCEELRM